MLTNVSVKESPKWLGDLLTATGIRPINTIVDITNYLMRAYGQPAHAFDYDEISKSSMKLRASKKREKLTTLDGKTHVLPGGDIVIEDGKGRLIDLCGIMGAQNSSIKESTHTIVLFLQTYNPVSIRRTSMKLAHRTEAAGLFEKGVDSELVLPAIMEGVRLVQEIAGGKIASKLYDIYPKPFIPYSVSVNRNKVDEFLGTSLKDKEIISILLPLGFQANVTKEEITVTVPSWRRDVTIDVDIIEEITRIYGYHRIASRLPEGKLPMNAPDPELLWEDEVKIRLRDWGYTEVYTYSMISEKQLDKMKAYKITNPLSEEWVYMRPSLRPGFLSAMKENFNNRNELRLFELSKVYHFCEGDLPQEEDMLIVGLTGDKYFETKGIGEAILALFGTPGALDAYGSLTRIGEITLLELSITKLSRDANPTKKYTPIQKYPPVVEDMAFIVPDRFEIGPLISAVKAAHPLIADVSLLDVHEDTRTLHITYQDPKRNLTGEDVIPIREKLIQLAKNQFGAILKSS